MRDGEVRKGVAFMTTPISEHQDWQVTDREDTEIHTEMQVILLTPY